MPTLLCNELIIVSLVGGFGLWLIGVNEPGGGLREQSLRTMKVHSKFNGNISKSCCQTTMMKLVAGISVSGATNIKLDSLQKGWILQVRPPSNIF